MRNLSRAVVGSGERILDLGIGLGGAYIRDDPREATRLGVDIKTTILSQDRRRFLIPVCAASAFLDPSSPLNNRPSVLPFRAGSFDSAEIKFPHDELLFSLVSPNAPLWEDLSRVLKPGGGVEVLFDVPDSRIRNVKVGGSELALKEPHEMMQRAATEAGFNVALSRIDEARLRRIGSYFSIQTADKVAKVADYEAFSLTATKHP